MPRQPLAGAGDLAELLAGQQSSPDRRFVLDPWTAMLDDAGNLPRWNDQDAIVIGEDDVAS